MRLKPPRVPAQDPAQKSRVGSAAKMMAAILIRMVAIIIRTWQIIYHKDSMLVACAIRARHACAIRWAEEY